ncbi:MAG: sugar phosphate isomerase/epimerase [Christensenellaceae bacterium]|jgi:sugar phosphate isomerase/epimerase|nr:sugar phosphate isomerase/epimerase [Christensenellaceae bacterium]
MKLETGITTNSKCSVSGRRTLEKIRVAGFKNVMLDQEGNRNLERFISVAFENGLKVPFIHMDSKGTESLWFDTPKKDEYLDYARKTIETCGRNGIESVVMHASYEGITIAPNKIGLESMNEIVKMASNNNVKIALENTDLETHNLFEFLLENIDSQNLGFCFDSGHWNLYMPQVDLLGKYGKKLTAVHLHDNVGISIQEDGWKKDLHLLPFDGTTDFNAVAKGIAKSNYQGPIMLESRRKHKAKEHRYYGIDEYEFLKRAHEKAERLSSMIES